MKIAIYAVAAFNAGMALQSSLIYYSIENAQAALPSIIIALATTAFTSATLYIIAKLHHDFPKWGS
jgi:hypothetical protein